MITATIQVQEYLERIDDLATAKQIREATNLNTNRVSAALSHLRKYNQVDFVEEDGVKYWFRTYEQDPRSHIVVERKEEVEPRAPRQKRDVKTMALALEGARLVKIK